MKHDKKRKQFIAKVESDDAERTVTAIISTDIVDRENEVLKPGGVDLEQFLKNPVVLWAHDYRSPPVGRAVWVTKSRKTIKAKAQFAETPRGQEVYELYKGGYLNAFSVGFQPTKGHEPTPDEIKKRPELAEANWIYDKWELLEFSAVPVPANPEALAQAVKSKELELSVEMAEMLDLEETFYTTSSTVNQAMDMTHSASAGGNEAFSVYENGGSSSSTWGTVPDVEPVVIVETIAVPVSIATVPKTAFHNYSQYLDIAEKRYKGIMF